MTEKRLIDADKELRALRAMNAMWERGAQNLLGIFNATAIALNGGPSPELGDWTPAMLPEKAGELRAKLVAALEENLGMLDELARLRSQPCQMLRCENRAYGKLGDVWACPEHCGPESPGQA